MRSLKAAALALLLTGSAQAAPPQYPGTGVGALWYEPKGGFSMTYQSGDASGLSAADAAMSTTGFGLLGPGTEGLTLPAYRAGVMWIWQRYDGYRVVGTPFESWPRGARQMRVDSTGVTADSSLTTPRVTTGRLGPASGPTYGGAIRIVDGVTFPLTVAGVQAAMNECGSAGGGTAMVPGTANILISTTGLKVPNRVRLMGMGALYDSIPTFYANSSTNVGAMIENARIDGTQQVAQLEHLTIRGDTTAVACSTAVRFRSIYVGSYARDLLITSVKGHGIVVDDPSASAVGTIDFENIVIGNLDATEGGDGIRVGSTTVGAVLPIRFRNLDIERWGAGGAGLRLQGVNCGGSGWSRDAVVDGLYLESRPDGNATGLLIHNFGIVDATNINLGSGGPMNYLVKISGAATSGFCGAYGVVLRNMYADQDTILFDQVNNVAFTNANGGHLYEYRTPSKSATAIPYIVNADSLRTGRITGSPRVGSSGLNANFWVGTGGTGTTTATASIDAGNSGTTRASLLFQRNTSTASSLFIEGTQLWVNNDAFVRYATLGGSTKSIFDMANGRYRVGDGTAPTESFETAGAATFGTVAHAALGTRANGTMIYCSDCTKATPCASGGSGAMAFRINGAWDCNP